MLDVPIPDTGRLSYKSVRICPYAKFVCLDTFLVSSSYDSAVWSTFWILVNRSASCAAQPSLHSQSTKWHSIRSANSGGPGLVCWPYLFNYSSGSLEIYKKNRTFFAKVLKVKRFSTWNFQILIAFLRRARILRRKKRFWANRSLWSWKSERSWCPHQ